MDEKEINLLYPRFDQREGTSDSQLRPNPVRRYATCRCVDYFQHVKSGKWQELGLHAEQQDTTSEALQALEWYVEKLAADGSDEFNPRRAIGLERWEQIITLPPSIAKLQSVKYFALYGSHLVRIPPEIGELAKLEEFDPYTSYCLHWFPYEITRCPKLKRSHVSTRALYGNYKYRPPFPRLPSKLPGIAPASCSVCRGPFKIAGPKQVWISLRVATDVLPLLVHACSDECIKKLPKPPDGYVQEPHRGGLAVDQPASEESYSYGDCLREAPLIAKLRIAKLR